MPDLTGMKLTFDDEFDTRSISQTGAGTKWSDIRNEWRFDAASDIGFGHSSFVDPASGYDPFNVSNGVLTITAVPDRTKSGYPGSWESGLITTQNTFSQTYGYFEMRADLSNQVGAWDAFWLLPTKSAPANGQWQELDVVEHYGDNDRGVYTHIHTTDPAPNVNWQQNLQVYSETPNPDGFHTYGMMWTADTLSFYVDGVLTGSKPTPSDMHSPMYLLANLATQGDGTNNADINGQPISMKIDYIRAYALPDTNGGTGTGSGTGTGTVTLKSVTGGAGNDTLDGRGAAYQMTGGAGNDTYLVDSTDDVVIEAANQGTDTVKTTLTTYTLTANVETLQFQTNAASHGIGNALANTLFGSGGNDTLEGLAGDDRLVGGADNDVLIGGAGRDTLEGGAGADRFVFNAGDFNTVAKPDAIKDFSSAQGDIIDLSSIAGLHFIGTAAFSGKAGDLRFQHVGADTFVYGDIDGNKVADFAIQLSGSQDLHSSDFLLY